VSSAWEPSELGPDRRTYELTRRGREELHRRAQGLAGLRVVVDVFLSRYGEFVSVAPRGARTPSPG
jgi:DNA-binding PadR family transcriptional regulator